MFCAVNTDVNQFVFDRQGRNFVDILVHESAPRETLFERQGSGKVAQREIVVQLDEQLCVAIGEKILAGNFAGVDGADGNGCHVTCGQQQFRGATDVALADEQV